MPARPFAPEFPSDERVRQPIAGVPGLELGREYAIFRPAGPTTVEGFLALLREVLKACQQAEVTRPLVDLTQLRHKPLSTVDRFWRASGLAELWDRKVKLAIVGRVSTCSLIVD